MSILRRISDVIGKYFGLLIVLFMLMGFAAPQNFVWVMGNIGSLSILTLLLSIIMFGMGMTLKIADFVLLFRRPSDVLLGVVAQFVIMPFLALALAKIFELSPELTAGVVLVGTSPGGTASNIITFMARGDLALSVTMTSVSSLLAPVMTPFLTYQLIGENISFDPIGMFWSIVQIVIIPVAVGILARNFLPRFSRTIIGYLPTISAFAIALIVAGIISVSRDHIINTSAIIILVVLVHNLLGYILGFCLARASGMSWRKSITVAIEVGMQNSGLAAGLAKAHFAAMPMAAVPGALFSAWHNISGAILAWLVSDRHLLDADED